MDEYTNLFSVPMTEKEQYELSDLLDNFTQWYDNYFDEENPDNEFDDGLTALYRMIDTMFRRAQKN